MQGVRQQLLEPSLERIFRISEVGVCLIDIRGSGRPQFPFVCIIFNKQGNVRSVEMKNRCGRIGGHVDALRRIHPVGFFRRLHPEPGAVDEGECSLIHHGSSVVIALNSSAPDFSQEGNLLLRLNSLGQRLHAQHSGHGHNRSDDLPAAVVEMTEEPHVDLDHIEMKVVKGVQRGILASEIIHPHLVAGLLEPADNLRHIQMVPDHDAFGDFEAQHRARNLVMCNDLFDGVNRIGHLEIICRKVDGNGNQRQPVVHPVSDQSCHLFQHAAVKPIDKLRFLQNRDENFRVNHAQHRVFQRASASKPHSFPVRVRITG